ncbi:YjzC family protein [Carnobacteriaceae bacterium zg-ZUI252]|nr:YjzC family protein [Carnobacteriaceae bacterium zg-ZUI252]
MSKFIEKGPKGVNIDKPRIVTIGKGDRLPPTQKPGNKWTKK